MIGQEKIIKKGLGYIVFEDGEFKGPIAKNMKKQNLEKLWKLLILKTAILFFFYIKSSK